MKQFLFKIGLWSIPVILWYTVLGSFADGNTDSNYNHFIQQSENIILGDSRGSQAVVPSVLDEKFNNRRFDNFSLNLNQSPYGWVYLKGLKKKLKKGTKSGIFILTIDAWNISLDKKVKNLDGLNEFSSPLDNVLLYISPNYEYLFKNYNKTWYYIYRDRVEQGKRASYVHPNGWMEVNVDMSPKEVVRREKIKNVFYENFRNHHRISHERLLALGEIIEFLKNHGEVYLVRVPGGEKISNIENNYAPQFNKIIDSISKKHHVPYFDFFSKHSEYSYTDGNHMYKVSGKIFTAQIADSIIEYQKLK